MPSEKQYLERKENIATILEHLRSNGAKSRRELSAELGLSWGCVSELVSILLLQNILLEEEAREAKTKGRIPTVLSLNPNIFFLGVDVNIIGLKGCVCRLTGEKTEEFSDKLNCNSKEEFMASICSFVNGIIDKYKISGIGFAMQGIFDAENNLWKLPTKSNISINFASELEGKFNLPIMVEHDPNCILYGCIEKNEGSKMIVRVDRGIGAAIYKNNVFWKNELLEIGYMVVNEKGERLYEVASLQGVTEEMKKSENRGLLEEYFSRAGKYLGIGLGNICNLISINEIYLCGDMVEYYELFSQKMEESFKATALSADKTKITAVRVTDAAFGAAKMAIEKFQY
ncbi:MAG: ROK family protein [Oscillospiraceae bacterium]|nr:ROK family protein [Oscillospiraceae bacterium]